MPRSVAELPRSKRARPARLRHQARKLDAGLQCNICHKVASRPASVATFASQECDANGACLVLDSLGLYANSKGHRLWLDGGVVFSVGIKDSGARAILVNQLFTQSAVQGQGVNGGLVVKCPLSRRQAVDSLWSMPCDR